MTAYSLTKAKMLPTGAFSATIKKGTKVVASVENSGRGGCDLISFLNQTERAEFTAEAKTVMGEDTFEVEDAFVSRLFSMFEISKIRTGVVTVKNPDEFFVDGVYSVIRHKGYTAEEITNAVKAQTPDRLLWNKTRQEFVPASQF